MPTHNEARDVPVPVRPATSADVTEVARLHVRALPDSFLATLGTAFLTRLYRRIQAEPSAFLLVGRDDAGLTGFVAVAEDTGLLYRRFLAHDGVGAAFSAAAQVARHPVKVFETLRYGTSHGEDLPGAEVLSTVVAARARSRGIGGRLMHEATAELERRGVPSARVVTASDNAAALRMYESAGFRRATTAEVHRGVVQQVLVWP